MRLAGHRKMATSSLFVYAISEARYLKVCGVRVGRNVRCPQSVGLSALEFRSHTRIRNIAVNIHVPFLIRRTLQSPSIFLYPISITKSRL